MDSEDLQQCMEYVSSSGLTLSPEEAAALRVSLRETGSRMRLSGVRLWGRVVALGGRDYLVADGVRDGADELTGRTTLYSLDGLKWQLLVQSAEVPDLRARFQGDPSYAHKLEPEQGGQQSNGEAHVTDEEATVKEEDRLAATITAIEHEAAVVPRGAFMRTPLGRVQRNPTFQGLSLEEAGKLRSYLHWRRPERLPKLSLLERAELDPALDFLDPIEHDVPAGCWSLQLERGGALVILRSLLWPGLTFYHVPGTPRHGYIYMGLGEKNIDLPFMI
ncbi:radial spoke head protein 9 homolog [Lethenteron reissneri]|uniref:radial spoke head protein 9 homolog n=1 Tax=Lethenteron reissneri TaxID=7753 RepID=UPI002AB6A3DA|nr:radial spoke head protein 9 homolog [Lethenteron reissneri]